MRWYGVRNGIESWYLQCNYSQYLVGEGDFVNIITDSFINIHVRLVFMNV